MIVNYGSKKICRVDTSGQRYYTFTTVILCHNYCTMALKYKDKKFYNIGPGVKLKYCSKLL